MRRYLETIVRQEGARFIAECSRVRARGESDSPEGALAGLEQALLEGPSPFGAPISAEDPIILVVALYCGRIAAVQDREAVL